MYNTIYLTVKDCCAFLGLGRNTVLRLCNEKPHGFPAVRVGARRWQIDYELLKAWKADWFNGKFDI